MIAQEPHVTPLAVDPLERRPSAAPVAKPAERRTLGSRMVLTAAGLCILAAGLAGGYAISTMEKSLRAADIRIGRVDDWPELKDGVPVLKAAATPAVAAPGAALVAAPATALPAQMSFSAPDLPSPVSLPAPSTAVEANRPPGDIAAPAATLAAAPLREERVSEIAPQPTAEDRTASLELRAQETIAEETSPSVAVPLPPRRPLDTVDPVRPKKIVAAPARQAAVPPGETTLSPPMSITPPQQQREEAPDSDRIDVLGVKVPTLTAAGRKVRDTLGSVGDAIRTLPDRF